MELLLPFQDINNYDFELGRQVVIFKYFERLVTVMRIIIIMPIITKWFRTNSGTDGHIQISSKTSNYNGNSTQNIYN